MTYIQRISASEWRAKGGLTNPKCSRRMAGGRWYYYYQH